MAKASLADMIGNADEVEAVKAAQPARPKVERPSAAAPIPAAEDARINFSIPRDLRQKFKAWAAQNDTSIKDELTRHIRSLVD